MTLIETWAAALAGDLLDLWVSAIAFLLVGLAALYWRPTIRVWLDGGERGLASGLAAMLVVSLASLASSVDWPPVVVALSRLVALLLVLFLALRWRDGKASRLLMAFGSDPAALWAMGVDGRGQCRRAFQLGVLAAVLAGMALGGAGPLSLVDGVALWAVLVAAMPFGRLVPMVCAPLPAIGGAISPLEPGTAITALALVLALVFLDMSRADGELA